MLNTFYGIMNFGYRVVFGSRYMLHAPLFLYDDDTLYDAQQRFSEHCLSYLPPLKALRVLDIGCGNGMPAVHLLDSQQPRLVHGIDTVASEIRTAQDHGRNDPRLVFTVDDAQQMNTVADQSVDVAICIESALHYPDKDRFLQQARRVLVPQGWLLIADLLQRRGRGNRITAKMFHLYNWSARQYGDAFSRYGFRIERDESLNDVLLPQFAGLFGRVKKETLAGKKWTARLMLPVIKAAAALYIYQLRHQFEYRLFVLNAAGDTDGM